MCQFSEREMANDGGEKARWGESWGPIIIFYIMYVFGYKIIFFSKNSNRRYHIFIFSLYNSKFIICFKKFKFCADNPSKPATRSVPVEASPRRAAAPRRCVFPVLEP